MLTPEQKHEAERMLKSMSSDMDFEKKIKNTVSTYLLIFRIKYQKDSGSHSQSQRRSQTAKKSPKGNSQQSTLGVIFSLSPKFWPYNNSTRAS